MRHKQRLKIIQASSGHQLERAVNDFIVTLDRAPLTMQFGTFGKYYEDNNKPWPEHIAYITYIENE